MLLLPCYTRLLLRRFYCFSLRLFIDILFLDAAAYIF